MPRGYFNQLMSPDLGHSKMQTNNPYLQLTKLHFAPILKETLLSLKKPSIINEFVHQHLTVTTQNDQFSSLSYGVFANTVGLDKSRSLENYCNTEEVGEDFKLLFKIYQKFQDSTKHQVAEVAEGDIDDSIIRVTENTHNTQKGDSETGIIKQSSPPKNNTIVNKGLCFTCVTNASLSKFAIRCQRRSRTYHYECLKKYNLYVEYFICKACQSKK
nr:unnamed protein product [Callosobruchus analis]